MSTYNNNTNNIYCKIYFEVNALFYMQFVFRKDNTDSSMRKKKKVLL